MELKQDTKQRALSTVELRSDSFDWRTASARKAARAGRGKVTAYWRTAKGELSASGSGGAFG